MSAFGYGALLVSLAAWLFFSGMACVAVFFYQRGLGRKIELRDGPVAVVIIPIRGATDNLHALWAGLRRQTYRRWRLVFVVESELDPAHAALARLIVPGSAGQPPTEIVVAGFATRSAQKIHNQLAAIAALRPDDAVLVFADADIVPASDWLMRLIEPLSNQEVWLATGYRWMTPGDHRLSTAYACLMNASIATMPRPMRWGLAWGGSMAIRRTTLEAIDIERWWRHSLSDDLQITRAIRQHGGTVYSPRELLVASPTACSWRQLVEFGRRQYTLVRAYAPRHWLLAAAATTIPLVGWMVAVPLAIVGDPIALAAIVAAAALDQTRAALRRRVVRILWNAPIDRRVALLDRWAGPTSLLIHAAIIWSTLPARTVSWAGRRYRLPAGSIRHRPVTRT
jgi:hypothetical protein